MEVFLIHHRIQRALGLCALLLGFGGNCLAYSPAVRPCAEAKLSDSWVGVTQDVAILLVLDADKSGWLQIWFKDKEGKPGKLSRRVESWQVAEDGNLQVRIDKKRVSHDLRSVNLLKANTQCRDSEFGAGIRADFWIEGVAYAELSLSPVAEFRAANRHLEMFFETLSKAR